MPDSLIADAFTVISPRAMDAAEAAELLRATLPTLHCREVRGLSEFIQKGSASDQIVIQPMQRNASETVLIEDYLCISRKVNQCLSEIRC